MTSHSPLPLREKIEEQERKKALGFQLVNYIKLGGAANDEPGEVKNLLEENKNLVARQMLKDVLGIGPGELTVISVHGDHGTSATALLQEDHEGHLHRQKLQEHREALRHKRRQKHNKHDIPTHCEHTGRPLTFLERLEHEKEQQHDEHECDLEHSAHL